MAAVDKAGNQSATLTYTFYVNDDPTAQVHPGDVDGDGRPDLLATNKVSNNLELYPTLNRAPTPVVTASDATDSPDGTSWANTLISHRSSAHQSSTGNRVDDLWAHKPGSGSLFLYSNNMNNVGGLAGNDNRYYTLANRSPVTRPGTCADADCTGYVSTDWSHVTQLIAPGDMDGDGIPDLLTVEDGTLWLYPGSTVSDHIGAQFTRQRLRDRASRRSRRRLR